MKQLFILILLFRSGSLIAQDLKQAEVVEDLQFLSANIERYNPALEKYHPEFKDLASQVIEGVNQENVSVFSLFTKASQLCAHANEGHFALGNWEDAVHKGVLENRSAYLPLQVKYCLGNLYVWRDYTNSQSFEPGDQILSINGMQTRDILDILLSVTPSDGDIETYAYRKIEAGFAPFYFYYIEQSLTFEIVYVKENGKEEKVSIQALTRAEQGENLRKNAPPQPASTSGPPSFYSLEYQDNFALLSLPSFDINRIRQANVKSKSFYKSMFADLRERQIKHLIVDLRNNTGGRNEFADDMVPFILKGSRKDPFLKKTYSWEGKERIYKMPKASKLAFQGQIYVLVNGKTFSAGSSLARYLKEYGGATVIGSETGTRYEGFAGGSKEYVSLPNSKFEIGIPRYLIQFPNSQLQKTQNRGLLPDHSIEYSFNDIAGKKDLHKVKALDLIRESQAK